MANPFLIFCLWSWPFCQSACFWSWSNRFDCLHTDHSWCFFKILFLLIETKTFHQWPSSLWSWPRRFIDRLGLDHGPSGCGSLSGRCCHSLSSVFVSFRNCLLRHVSLSLTPLSLSPSVCPPVYNSLHFSLQKKYAGANRTSGHTDAICTHLVCTNRGDWSMKIRVAAAFCWLWNGDDLKGSLSVGGWVYELSPTFHEGIMWAISPVDEALATMDICLTVRFHAILAAEFNEPANDTRKAFGLFTATYLQF